MQIETPRLLLRQWQDGDRAAFAAVNADADVRRYYYPSILSAAASDALVDEQIAHLREHGYGFLAVQRKADGAFVGGAGLSRPGAEVPGGHAVEIGWILGRAHWRQSYATEAALACFAWAWRHLDCAAIVGYTAALNTPSQRAMERVGMQRIAGADFDDTTVPPGHALRPHQLYAIARPGPAA